MSRNRSWRSRDWAPEIHRRADPDAPEDHQIMHFDASHEFASWARQALEDRTPEKAHYYSGSRYESLPRVVEGMRILEEGNEDGLDEAERLLDNFHENIPTVTTRRELSIVGACPDVPSFLSGVPTNMWVRTPAFVSQAPLRVWVGLTSSSGVSEDQLRQRGITLAAFALAMQEIRPVYITPYVNLGWWTEDRSRAAYEGIHSSVISWDIQTHPLVLAELLGCLSKPEVTRYLGITACNLHNPSVNGHCNPVLGSEADMRRLLNIPENDLFLGQIHLYDPMLTNPVQWLKDKISHYTDRDNAI